MIFSVRATESGSRMSTYKSKQLGRIMEEVLIFHVSLCAFSLHSQKENTVIFFSKSRLFLPKSTAQRVIGEVGRRNWVLTHESYMRSLLKQLTLRNQAFSAYEMCTFIKVLLEAYYLGN